MVFRISRDPLVRFSLAGWVFLFSVLFGLIVHNQWITSTSHLDEFDAAATLALNEGKIVDQNHPAFREYDKVCLFSRLGAKHRETEGCGTFEYGAIGMIIDGQCKVFSADKIKATIYFEYDVECRDKKAGFQLKIFDRNDVRASNSLVFVDDN